MATIACIIGIDGRSVFNLPNQCPNIGNDVPPCNLNDKIGIPEKARILGSIINDKPLTVTFAKFSVVTITIEC